MSLDREIQNTKALVRNINADTDLVFSRLTRTPDVDVLKNGLECLRMLQEERIKTESQLRNLLRREQETFLTERSERASDFVLKYHLAI